MPDRIAAVRARPGPCIIDATSVATTMAMLHTMIDAGVLGRPACATRANTSCTSKVDTATAASAAMMEPFDTPAATAAVPARTSRGAHLPHTVAATAPSARAVIPLSWAESRSTPSTGRIEMFCTHCRSRHCCTTARVRKIGNALAKIECGAAIAPITSDRPSPASTCRGRSAPASADENTMALASGAVATDPPDDGNTRHPNTQSWAIDAPPVPTTGTPTSAAARSTSRFTPCGAHDTTIIPSTLLAATALPNVTSVAAAILLATGRTDAGESVTPPPVSTTTVAVLRDDAVSSPTAHFTNWIPTRSIPRRVNCRRTASINSSPVPTCPHPPPDDPTSRIRGRSTTDFIACQSRGLKVAHHIRT
eukprot:m.219259 g.219259  ORF g.219259 m.219259 type:complete len:365 (+) comp25747_c0_seq1:1024-2118(+)